MQHEEGKGLPDDNVLEARREAFITKMVERKAASLATKSIEDLVCTHSLEAISLEAIRLYIISIRLEFFKEELRDSLQFEEDDAAGLN
jgi:hypothetical protein